MNRMVRGLTLAGRTSFLLHLNARLSIERAERLIHEQDRPGRGTSGACDCDALLHAAGELMGIGILVTGEVHEFDHSADPGAALIAGDTFVRTPTSAMFP